MSGDDSGRRVRYQPDDRPPLALSFGLGLQLAILVLAGIVLIPTVVVRAAGGGEAYLSWVVFAAVAVCGLTTALQALRIGRIGAGYILVGGSSAAFIAVCVVAIAEGGPALLATLIVVASLCQFALSAKLSLFRRILTPTVAGTVVMLLPVTVMPVVFGMLTDVPAGSPAPAAPLTALVTLVVIAGVALKATGALRLWAPVIGVVVGSAVAGAFGLYNLDRVAAASWLGLPQGGWPGFDLDFGPAFWGLLPAFVFVALIDTARMISYAIASQQVSWRRPRAVDFRAVQGAVAAGGIGNLLSGLTGTVPNTVYSSGISVTELTGVAARRVGVALGLVLIALAFLPKLLALVLAIPGPVAAAYLALLMALLFVVGVKMVVRDGIDYRQGLIVGVAFWIGVGFQNGLIFPEQLSGFAGELLANGMVAGGLVAILMTLFLELTAPRRSRLETEFELAALAKIREFLGEFASRSGWDRAMAERLEAASEETLLTLGRQAGERRRLRLVARKEGGGAVLEFVTSVGGENLQDRITLLSEQTDEVAGEREVSLRLLRHLATSVRHQQYHDLDIVTVRVQAPGSIRHSQER